MREVTAGTSETGHGGRLVEHAVDAVADPHLVLLRLEVDVGGAAVDGLADHALDELDDRGVLAADAERDGLGREVVDRAPARAAPRSRSVSSGSSTGRGGAAAAPVGVVDAVEDVVDVGRRGDGRADLVAGHHRDVVDGEHVGGVGHGDEQRAVAGERDRAPPGSA